MSRPDSSGEMTRIDPAPVLQETREDEAPRDRDANQRLAERQAERNLWQRLQKVVLFLVSVALFVLAIELLKGGARSTVPLIVNGLGVNSLPNALGLGWSAAYLIMSGSPVAAVALAFLDTGALDRLQTYGMITGSRLGASFIVLFIGFVHILRDREKKTGLAMGLLCLIVTGSIYLPALGIGSLLLDRRILDSVQLDQGAILGSALDRVLGPIIQPLLATLPGWGAFLLGLGIILVSFFLFDRILPELHLERGGFASIAHIAYRPLVMLLLGGALTLVTLSVSLSLSLLIPLSARGYVRPENVIPYIMGANITTVVDTLLAAVFLGNADAFTVVLTCMVSVALVSLVTLLLFFRSYERTMLSLVAWILSRNRNLALFMFTILAVPVVLMLI